MAGERTRFRARTIRATTLWVLTETVAGRPPSGHEPEWTELVQARIASSPGVVRPTWLEVLTDVASGPVVMTVNGRMGRAGMRSTITLTPRFGLSLTERRRLTVTDSEVVVDAVEDVVEIALFEPGDVWPAVQRVLPPSALVRADGGSSPRAERTVGLVQQAPRRADLPPEVLTDLAAADVEISLMIQVDSGGETPFVGTRFWSETPDRGLLEVRLREGATEVVDVPQGSIADEIVWLAAGAHDLRTRAAREAS